MKRNQFSAFLVVVILILLPKFSFGQGTSQPAASANAVDQSDAKQKAEEAKKERVRRIVQERRQKLLEIQKRREEYAKRGRFPYANPGQARLFPEVMKTTGQHSEINEITVAELVNGAYGANPQQRLRLALALAGFAENGDLNPALPDQVWEEFKQNILTNRYTKTRFAGKDFDLRMVYGIPDAKANLTVKATSYPPEMIGFEIVGLKVNGIVAPSGPYQGKLINFVIVTAFKFPDRTEVEVGCGNITGVVNELPPPPQRPAPAIVQPPPVPPPPPQPPQVTVVVNKTWNNSKGEAVKLPKEFEQVRFDGIGSDGTEYHDLRLDHSGLRLELKASPGTTIEVVENPETQVKGFKDKTRKLVINVPELVDQVVIVPQPYVNEKGRGCHIGPLPCWAGAVIAAVAVPIIYKVLEPTPKPKPPEPKPPEPQKTGGPGPSPVVTGLSLGVSPGTSGGITIRF